MKKLFLLFNILISLIIFGQDLNNGLIAYYPLNNSVADEKGNHNGTSYNLTASNDRNGNANSCFYFNGYNSYIDLKENFIGNSNFTISLWFKTDYDGHINTLVSTRHNDNSFSHTIVIENNKLELSLDGPGYFKLFKGNKNVNDNSWHFLTVIKNSSNYNLFLDGNEISSGSGNISTNNSAIHIGHHGAWNNFFKGSIDEVRFYNRALSNNEILELFKNKDKVKIIEKEKLDLPIESQNTKNDDKLRTEKWMLLYKHNPIFTFNFEDKSINVINTKNQNFTLYKSNNNTFSGGENNSNNESVSYNSFFLEESYQQERGTYYSFQYLSPYKIKMYFQQNWRNFLGYSENKQEYIFIKDLKNENEKSVADLEKLGIVYRTEFKNGKIGEDYVPVITSVYNAGKTYNVGGVTIQEEDYQTKVTDGGYSNDINGYTAIYQLVNKSTKNYLINYTINGTSKMTDIVKNRKWFSYDKYNTEVTYNDFDYTKTIILKPNESLKDQLIVGTEIPINYALLVNEIKEVSNDWLLNLNNAVSGSNAIKAKEFLNDELAKKYYNHKISENIDNLNKKQIQTFTNNNKKFISITIKPKDETLFDIDFQSEVETKIVNNSMNKVKVKYETPFGTEEVIVEPKKNTIVTNSIKGIEKINLKAKIVTIEKVD